MKRITWIALLVGALGLTALIAWQGADDLAATFARAGWQVFWLPVVFVVPLALATASWRVLFLPGTGPGLARATVANWICLGINWLLPVAQVGGEFARARIATRDPRCSGDAAMASVVVDKTLQVATQVVYALAGLLAFLAVTASEKVVIGTVAFLVIFGVLTLLFYRAQRRGLFGRLAGMAGKMAPSKADGMADSAARVDAAVHAMWEHRVRVVLGFTLRLAFRVVLLLEVWLALQFLGYREATLLDALILESLGQAVRAASFAIPGGIGAQEGGFALIGVALGLPVDVAIAVSLCKRVRELVVGVPALLVWQWEEGRALLRRPTVPVPETSAEGG